MIISSEQTKLLDFRAFTLVRWPSIGIDVYYDLYIFFKESAENVILKRLFTLGLGLVLCREGGGDSVVFKSVVFPHSSILPKGRFQKV